MSDLLFTFEEKRVPPVVVMATAALIAIFALGLIYQVLSILLF
ncbi:hypothetical protein [Halovivax sp.]|nr:hypothetical protein [Halovivax sp.]